MDCTSYFAAGIERVFLLGFFCGDEEEIMSVCEAYIVRF